MAVPDLRRSEKTEDKIQGESISQGGNKWKEKGRGLG